MGDELCCDIGKSPSKGSLYEKMSQNRDYTASLRQRLDASIAVFRGLEPDCPTNKLCELCDRPESDFMPLLQTEDELNSIEVLISELDRLGRLYKKK